LDGLVDCLRSFKRDETNNKIHFRDFDLLRESLGENAHTLIDIFNECAFNVTLHTRAS
jgi:hypothetical protein